MSSHTLIGSVDLSELPEGSWIVEVGSVREPFDADSEENSTVWLDRFASERGMGFATCDFSAAVFENARSFCGDKANCGDGATFLAAFEHPIGFLYLDNFDVVYNDKHRESLMRRVGSVYEENAEEITNERSAQVHLEQVLAAWPHLTSPAFIGFDDTMKRDGVNWWGKGATGVPYLLSKGWAIVAESDDGVLLTGDPAAGE